MIELNIPGRGTYQLEHLVSDVNGTLALDGQLLDGLVRQLSVLEKRPNKKHNTWVNWGQIML
jgi:soluble P-type ATPase